MIRDWDLWPWMVADGADALPVYRLERGVRHMQRMIGGALYPILRRLAHDLRRDLDRPTAAAVRPEEPPEQDQ